MHGIGSKVVPATRQQLADAGLGEPEVANIRVEGHPPNDCRIVAQVQRVFAGRTLTGGERELEGRALCESVAELIVENRIFDRAAEPVRDDLHLWDILAAWPEADRYWESPGEAPELKKYLADRLWELGLRESADLMLVEPEDLRPDLSELFGIAEFEIDRWREDFPRVWEHMGAEYVCNVQPATEKVILEPANRGAKEGEDPVAKHLPKFRGFSVYFRNASRVVPIRA